MRALPLFNLKPGKTIENYKKWSSAEVHPRMLRMPSVIAFKDYEVTGAMNGVVVPYQLVEEIEITDPEVFGRDNAVDDGAVLAKEWQSWVGSFVVIYCQENL